MLFTGIVASWALVFDADSGMLFTHLILNYYGIRRGKVRPIVATLVFLLLDSLWLMFIAKKFYIASFGNLLRLENGSIAPLWIPTLVVYVALIVGILVFAIPKAHEQLWPALWWGALFGFVTYATYDFTNLAVMANWPVKAVIVDTLWGMVLCGTTSLVTVWLTR